MKHETKLGNGCLVIVMLITGILFSIYGLKGIVSGKEVTLDDRRAGDYTVNGFYFVIPGLIFVGISCMVIRNYWNSR
jgi:hypothetical protein